MRKTLMFILLVFVLVNTLPCFAENLELSDSDILEIDLGPIPKHVKPPSRGAFATAMLNNSVTSPPLVLLLHVGYKGFAAPDDAVFECWENFDSYFPGNLVYFGFIIANFEPVKKTVGVQLELSGGKTLTYKAKKAVPAQRGRAYFIRKTLGNETAAYQLVVGLGDLNAGVPKPGAIYDIMLARFIINQVF